MTTPPPVGPQYDPEQMRAVNARDIRRHRQEAMDQTRVGVVLLIVEGVVWMTLIVLWLRS